VTSDPSPDQERFQRMLRGLEQAPRYRGISFRGRTPDAAFGPHSATVVTRLLTPTSRDIRVATENFVTSSVYAILGGAGRWVENFSSRPQECEVVFLPATMFRPVDLLHAGGVEIIVVEQLAFDEADRPEGTWTPERVHTILPDHVIRSRQAEPVAVASTGKFLGDIS
jgi:hypothetical protein